MIEKYHRVFAYKESEVIKMNFEKIKEFLIEKKVYVIAIVLLGVGGFMYFQNNKENSIDNSDLVTEQVDKKDNRELSSSEKSSSPQASSTNTQSQQDTVTCDISGAVKHPGVYTLKNGARLNDLLSAAGGVTKRANLKNINRALLLKDQDQVYVPHKGEKVETIPSTVGTTTSTTTSSSTVTSAATGSSSSSEKVNINTASVQDLQKLSGIGEKRAEQIISYREQNGTFKSLEDLTKISGIGEKTLEKLKDQLEL